MAKKKVNWSLESSMDMIEIMDYYNNRNKSKIYSLKLYKDIQLKLKSLDFSIAFPKKTTDNKLFYITHNHIFIAFDIINTTLKVHIAIDERRNPELIKKLLNDLD
jgi:hypothetical protein